MPNYVALKAAIAAAPYAGQTDAQIVAALNASTVTLALDTTGAAVRGVLYPRNSWDRVEGVASGQIPVTAITPGTGFTAAQIVVICLLLVKMADQGAAIPMSVPAIAAKIGADLAALQGAKLTDTKGVLWAAGEFATGDPGDAAVLTAALGSTTTPAAQLGWRAPIVEDDLVAARVLP